MDQERQRIQDDLRGLIAGEVRCDDLFLQLYASDGSIYQIKPLGVVRPRSTADVAACAQYASENQIPLHARGAGTGLAGDSLGPGLIIDFSAAMRRIMSVDAETVRVQPGVVHAVLNDHLRPLGRHFGPDPALSDVTTLGSAIAIDASGSHWLRYGATRRHVESLQIVLADGEVMEVSRHSIDGNATEQNGSRRQQIVQQLAHLLQRHGDLIREKRPKCPVNRSGYALDDVLRDGQLDLARLLVGSEGTLALITEATLRTDPMPRYQGVVLLWFDSLDRASRAVLEILPLAPSACDLMDRRHLSLARESDVRYELLIPQQAEAVLLVEQDGASAQEVRDRLNQVVTRVERKKRLASGSHWSLDARDVDLYWQLARKYVPTLSRMKGSTRPVPFVEDLAVPPAALPEFLVRLQNVLKHYHVTASLFGHVGHGQLHVRPLLDLTNSDDVAKLQPLAEALYREVFDVGGTVSGEHADGLSRTPFLHLQFGPLVDVFRDVKRIFDPAGILNPGKIVPMAPTTLVHDLRPEANSTARITTAAPEGDGPPGPHEPLVRLQLAWDAPQMAEAARQCTGCGVCRVQSAEVRMCPIFRVAPREEASPRAKANLIRGILAGELSLETFTHDDFKQVADLCVHCHMCRLECPVSVDIPKLMVEAKAAYVATNGVRPTDWFMTRVDRLSALGCMFRPLANWAIANRQARWVLEKTLGIAQGRKLPRFARRSFLQRAARMRITRPTRGSGPKAALFVDTYANYHDPQIAEALVAVLKHNGVSVYVHPRQKHSAMTMIAHGALDKARQLAEHNIALLAEAVRQGYSIVTTEPSAALALTREYLHLIDDDEARLVAAHTFEACHYLWRRHQLGRLQLDFKPQNLTLAYHVPCHLKALEIGSPAENLLRLVPGVVVRKLEQGCSGMAGTYGLKRENYRSSLRAGWGLISALRDETLQAGTTECSTCKMQMEQGTRKPTIHPVKILALAYGLMPKVALLLTTPGEERVVT
jgi:FAD/FMN-containing dehydrogenase/Fe-S oxidoreductase